MGSVPHLIKVIPEWDEKHTNAFKKIKQAIKTIVEKRHFNIKNETRVNCHASKEGLAARLQQKEKMLRTQYHTQADLSTKTKERYSINEIK